MQEEPIMFEERDGRIVPREIVYKAAEPFCKKRWHHSERVKEHVLHNRTYKEEDIYYFRMEFSLVYKYQGDIIVDGTGQVLAREEAERIQRILTTYYYLLGDEWVAVRWKRLAGVMIPNAMILLNLLNEESYQNGITEKQKRIVRETRAVILRFVSAYEKYESFYKCWYSVSSEKCLTKEAYDTAYRLLDQLIHHTFAIFETYNQMRRILRINMLKMMFFSLNNKWGIFRYYRKVCGVWMRSRWMKELFICRVKIKYFNRVKGEKNKQKMKKKILKRADTWFKYINRKLLRNK